MTKKNEHEYVAYLMDGVFIEIDNNLEDFLSLDVDYMTEELNKEIKQVRNELKEGTK